MRATAFQNRLSAGKILASHLTSLRERDDVVVLAIPRGGVPVGFEVAKALNAPLDVHIVRKLGVPGHAELAMGAVASGGIIIRNEDIIEALNVPDPLLEKVLEEEMVELQRRDRLYRNERPPARYRDKIVVLVDDGLATGASITAAYKAILCHSPSQIVIAAPVGSPDTCNALDEKFGHGTCRCALTPEPLSSIGSWYHDFHQVTDGEVAMLLERAQRELPPCPQTEN